MLLYNQVSLKNGNRKFVLDSRCPPATAPSLSKRSQSCQMLCRLAFMTSSHRSCPSHFKPSQIYTVQRRTPVASTLLSLPLSQNAWPRSISHPLSLRGFIKLSEPCFIIRRSCSPVSVCNCFLAML